MHTTIVIFSGEQKRERDDSGRHKDQSSAGAAAASSAGRERRHERRRSASPVVVRRQQGDSGRHGGGGVSRHAGGARDQQPRQASPAFSSADERAERDNRRSATPSGPSQQRELTPELEDSKEKLSMSIEETNKLRAKLGLKPLQIEASPRHAAKKNERGDHEVFVRTENIADKREAEKFREKVRTLREKQVFREKYEKVKSLADTDEEADEDAAAWIEKSRALAAEKARAAQREKMLQEMESQLGIDDLVKRELKVSKKTYSAKDLQGLEIAHKQDRIKAGQTVVLTLKDRGILDDGDDVLENVNLVDDERIERSNFNKKCGLNTYNPYDDEEIDEFGIVHKKSVLSKYDEEIAGGPKENSFKIGCFTGSEQERRQHELEVIRTKLHQKQKESLVLPTPIIARDFLTPEEQRDAVASFKKPKKKVRRMRQRDALKADDLMPLNSVSNACSSQDHGSRNRRRSLASGLQFNADPDENLIGPDVDLSNVKIEDDLPEGEYLSKLTRQKAAIRAEDSLQQLASQIAAIKDEPEDEAVVSGRVFDPLKDLDATHEFCKTLGVTPAYGGRLDDRGERLRSVNDPEQDEAMDFENGGESRGEQDSGDDQRNAWAEVDPSAQTDMTEQNQQASLSRVTEDNGSAVGIGNYGLSMEPPLSILEEEPSVAIGVAGALKLAMKKGYIEDESKNKPAAVKTLQDLQAKNYTIEEKYYDDDNRGRQRGGASSHYHGPVSDFKDKSSYRPEVKLEYIDDSGRLLSSKEAFRYLSHKFHGKGSGKNKIDKRQKKIEQMNKLEQMSSVDTPLNTLKLLQEKQKRLQTPYIMLSGGAANTLTGPSGKLSKK